MLGLVQVAAPEHLRVSLLKAGRGHGKEVFGTLGKSPKRKIPSVRNAWQVANSSVGVVIGPDSCEYVPAPGKPRTGCSLYTENATVLIV